MKQALPLILTAVVVGALGFFSGIKYEQSQTRSRFSQFVGGRGGNFAIGRGGNQGTQNGNGQNRSFNQVVVGNIIGTGNNSITVQMPDGSSKIILFSDSTTINQAASASASDLTTGQRVMVFGTTNSDGSETAQSIEINPPQRNFGPSANTSPAPAQ